MPISMQRHQIPSGLLVLFSTRGGHKVVMYLAISSFMLWFLVLVRLRSTLSGQYFRSSCLQSPRFSFTSASRVRKKNLSTALTKVKEYSSSRICQNCSEADQNSSTSLFLLAAGDMGMASLATSFRMYYSLLSMTSNTSQQSLLEWPWSNGKSENRGINAHVFIGRVIVQAYYILMTML